jgi:hypothetical protein
MPKPVRADPRVSPNLCLVEPFTDQVLHSAAELAKALKRLRRAMKRCDACVSGSDCPVLASFNSKFETALQQVTDEWQLT